jgi:light-harvesting complex I chlorophyll a/b binding protein 1/light-harvesting complex I chlorophyll a/b binding protein 4
LGFAETFDPKWLREAEIKHGRVSMLAVVGFLVQGSGIHLPGALYETANPIDAFFTILKSDYPINPWIQIILTIGYLEWTNHDGKISMNDMHEGSDREVGEFKAPFYGAGLLKKKTPEYIADKKLKELQNGRLAMVAIGGMVHHQIIAGTEIFGSFPNPHLWEGLSVNLPNLYH